MKFSIKVSPGVLYSYKLSNFCKIPFSSFFLNFFTESQLKCQEVYIIQPHISPTTHLYTVKKFYRKFSWKNNFDYILIEIKVIISRQFYFGIPGTWLERGHI